MAKRRVVSKVALTPKQKRFADEYLVDLNATRAYKAAYPSVKKDSVAAQSGSRLLRNAKVQEYILERMAERQKRTEITQDWVLRELYKIASASGADFAQVVRRPVLTQNNTYLIDPDTGQLRMEDAVELIPTADLSEDKKAAIASIKEGRYGISVETYDRVKALELIGRHLGMFKDGQQTEGDGESGVIMMPPVKEAEQ